jgi:hypothetical protein
MFVSRIFFCGFAKCLKNKTEIARAQRSLVEKEEIELKEMPMTLNNWKWAISMVNSRAWTLHGIRYFVPMVGRRQQFVLFFFSVTRYLHDRN